MKLKLNFFPAMQKSKKAQSARSVLKEKKVIAIVCNYVTICRMLENQW